MGYWINAGAGGELGFEFLVDAEAGGGVGDLAEEGGGEARVEACEAVVAEDVEEGAGHGGGHGARAGLEADFNCRGVSMGGDKRGGKGGGKQTQVEGVSDAGGHGGCAASEPEGVVDWFLF